MHPVSYQPHHRLPTSSLVLAWTSEDQSVTTTLLDLFYGVHYNVEPTASNIVPFPSHSEIFDLVSALEAAEGPKVDFYSFLNVSPSATTSEISKAYRRRSLEIHPDRGGDPDRFARMGTIAEILRDAEKRKR